MYRSLPLTSANTLMSCDTFDSSRCEPGGACLDSDRSIGRNSPKGTPKVLSVPFPSIHHSAFPTPASGGQHFGDTLVAAEANELVAALQRPLPTVFSRIIARVRIVFQSGREVAVVARVDASMAQHGILRRNVRRPHR